MKESPVSSYYPQVEILRAPPRRRRWLVAAVLGLVLLVLGGWLINRQAREAEREVRFRQAVLSADKAIHDKRYDWAIASLTKQLSQADGPGQRSQVTQRLGTAYYYKGDYRQAIEWLEAAQASASQPDPMLTLSIAQAAERLGDKPKASRAYRQVIEYLKAGGNPAAKANIKLYEAKIKALSGGA
ncbi:hypothetical protein KY386_01800 [Candidatus Parcubacteria bacterium]|nr:hypothetical protein [Candidatus Parcubacteria bacterium]